MKVIFSIAKLSTK